MARPERRHDSGPCAVDDRFARRADAGESIVGTLTVPARKFATSLRVEAATAVHSAGWQTCPRSPTGCSDHAVTDQRGQAAAGSRLRRIRLEICRQVPLHLACFLTSA